ncbi:hypothetical protein Tco_1332817 [Tanacetum coccineum]
MADRVDSFDSDCDEDLTASAIFMEKISPAGSVTDNDVAFRKHLDEKHVTWDRFRKKLDKNTTLQAGDSYPDTFTKYG